MTESDRIKSALRMAYEFGGLDGAHHKQWVIAQMVKALCGGEEVDYELSAAEFSVTDEYREFVRRYKEGPAGPDTYRWDEGIAP